MKLKLASLLFLFVWCGCKPLCAKEGDYYKVFGKAAVPGLVCIYDCSVKKCECVLLLSPCI